MSEPRRYTPRGCTWDPCHACQKEPVGGPRKRDRICEDCRRIFSRALERDAELAERRDVGGRVPFIFRERAYALPYVGDCDRDPVQESFFELAQLVSEPTAEKPPARRLDPRDHYERIDETEWGLWPFAPNARREWTCYRAIEKPVALAIRAAYAAVMRAVAEAHANGFKEGQSLIAQLASGTITSDRFNDVVLRNAAELGGDRG